jgi:uncharacterized protein YecE (DUF72 family)
MTRPAYYFRDFGPDVHFATASDRYAGWLGQIYSQDADYKITKSDKTIKGERYVEEKLPVRSVTEYFAHYGALEIDFTFYAFLLDAKGEPSRNYQPLVEYARYIPADAKVLLKVPEAITATARWTTVGGKRTHGTNTQYLDPESFIRQFYEPATALLGKRIAAFIFEKGYQRKDSCPPPEENIATLSRFFDSIPDDDRFHIEERTDRLKTPNYFEFLRERKIGNVFSHWTWLPDLKRQWGQAGGFTSSVGVMRLLTPLRATYEETYARYAPFNRLVDELPDMYRDAAFIIRSGVEIGLPVITVVNNRAGGNAPEITRRIVEQLELSAK